MRSRSPKTNICKGVWCKIDMRRRRKGLRRCVGNIPRWRIGRGWTRLPLGSRFVQDKLVDGRIEGGERSGVVSAVSMLLLKPKGRCWLGGCGLWTMVSLAAVFDFELKLRVLFPKDLGCVFCCNRAAKKFPVGLFDGGNCLVDNLYYGTRLRVWVSIATVGAMVKLTVFPALLKSML